MKQKQLTMAELNQICAALRYWQRTVSPGVPEEEAIYFEYGETRPLTAEEIDALCIKINCEEDENDSQIS